MFEYALVGPGQVSSPAAVAAEALGVDTKKMWRGLGLLLGGLGDDRLGFFPNAANNAKTQNETGQICIKRRQDRFLGESTQGGEIF